MDDYFSRFLNLGWQLRQYLTELIGTRTNNLSLYISSFTKLLGIWVADILEHLAILFLLLILSCKFLSTGFLVSFLYLYEQLV